MTSQERVVRNLVAFHLEQKMMRLTSDTETMDRRLVVRVADLRRGGTRKIIAMYPTVVERIVDDRTARPQRHWRHTARKAKFRSSYRLMYRQWYTDVQISQLRLVVGSKSTNIISWSIIIIPRWYIVLSSWPQVIVRVHLMNCRTAHKQPSTLRPSRLTWAVSPPVGCYCLHPPSPFIINTQPEKLILIYHPTQGRRLSWPRHCRKGAHSPCPRL